MQSFSPPDPTDSRTPRERMLAGDWYRADAELDALASRAAGLAARWAQAVWAGDPTASDLLAELLPHRGEGVAIRPPLALDYGTRITIGPGTFINSGLTALDVAPITIGAHCQIGPQVQLLTPLHPLEPGPRRDGWETAAPVTLGDNVWLGGGVIVCAGVTIGDDTVVGAGSVVTRDLPAGVLAAGNPARVVRELPRGS
ncbi:sugar O-acetyltransferase [Nocardioides sp.]|uniref:sugar O-acetyltransferase n=1 Tax=Nocardioides sp. TaxID=35761 RepID=UPI003515484F